MKRTIAVVVEKDEYDDEEEDSFLEIGEDETANVIQKLKRGKNSLI